MRVISGLIPPGGWQYRQKLTSSPQRPQHQLIQAASYDQLLEWVFKFRLNNLEMIPLGTATKEQVERDVMYYVCGHYPRNCTGSLAQLNAAAGGAVPPAYGGRASYTRPSNRIEAWITLLTEKTLHWVDQSRALERAQICVKCPLNQPWQTGCGPCNANVARRAMLIRGSRTTGLEEKLKACVAYGTLNDLSVWLEDNFAAPKRQPPAQCWKLAEALKPA